MIYILNSWFPAYFWYHHFISLFALFMGVQLESKVINQIEKSNKNWLVFVYFGCTIHLIHITQAYCFCIFLKFSTCLSASDFIFLIFYRNIKNVLTAFLYYSLRNFYSVSIYILCILSFHLISLFVFCIFVCLSFCPS